MPIRVELDTETLRVRDAFVWNLNEELITPQQFARAFCADLDIPPQPHADNVAGAIRAQLDEHAPIAAMDLRGALITPEGTVDHFAAGPGDEVPDCRVLLSLDVQIDARHLVDHVEWDLLSPLSPEDFARGLCADMGLGGEAVPLVAHAVHEELLKHKRDALEWGILDDASGAYVRSMGLGGSGWGKQGGAPRRLKSVWREWAEIEEYGFCPRLDVLSQEEVERREIERERASRCVAPLSAVPDRSLAFQAAPARNLALPKHGLRPQAAVSMVTWHASSACLGCITYYSWAVMN